MFPSQLNTMFRAFLLYATKMDPSKVYLGNAIDGVPLPATESFLVFTELFATPKATSFEAFDVELGETPAEDIGTWQVGQLHHVTYQVDAWGREGIDALSKAKTIFTSGIGAEFFKRYLDVYGGVGIVSAKMWNNTTTANETPNYEERRTCDFILAVRLVAAVEWDWAERLEIDINGKQL